MGKTYIQNLGLFVTEKCNLDCAHCCRGGCSNKNLKDEVISSTFDQIDMLSSLSICGGEPTLAVLQIEKVFSYIIDRKIKLDRVYMFINGTKYSEELLRLLREMNDYITIIKNLPRYQRTCAFGISADQFHIDSMEERGLFYDYLENCLMYKESPYFDNIIDLQYPIFREGKANNLPTYLTIPLKKFGYIIAHNEHNPLNSVCYLGPLISINVDGIVTECDASWKHQRTKYNYGNVLEDSLENILIKNNAELVDSDEFASKSNRLIKNYYE